MLPYLLVFAGSIFFTYLAEKNFNKDKNKSALLLSSFAVVIPCILASLRSNAIGIDVNVYVKPLYDVAMSFQNFPGFYIISNTEVLFAFLIYVFANYFENYSLLLFSIELLIFLPLYICAYKFRNKYPMYMVIGVYLFIFYCTSLCVMRQSIAVSILLLAYTLFLEHNKVSLKIVFLVIVAFLFHSSALFGLLSVILIEFCDRGSRKFFKKIIVLLVCITGILFMSEIIEILSSYLPFLTKYGNHLTDIKQEGFSKGEVIMSFSFLIYSFISLKNIDFETKIINKKFRECIFVSFLLTLLMSITINLSRLNLYFSIYLIFTLPITVNAFKDEGKIFSRITVFLMAFIYFIIVHCIWNYWATYPFEFM